MKSAFNKEIVRSIKGSIGRFIAIAIISLLGAGVYAGLRMSAPDMRLAGDEFFDATSLYDISVVSNFGLDEDSINTLQEVDGVDHIMKAYRSDAVISAHDQNYVAQIESLSVAAAGSDTSDGIHAKSYDDAYLNRPILLEGNWPKGYAQCVMGAEAAAAADIAVGDRITIAEVDGDIDDVFRVVEFTVSGLVNSSAFIANEQMGTSTLGNGSIEQYIYIPAQAFNNDFPISVAYIAVDAAKDKTWDSADYDAEVSRVMRNIEETAAPLIAEERDEAVFGPAREELDDARDAFNKEKTKAETELSDAEKQLEESDKKLADSKKEIDENRTKLEDTHKQLTQTKETLDKSEAEYQSGKAQVDAQRSQLQSGINSLPTLKQQRDQLAAIPQPTEQQKTQLATLNEQIKQIESGISALNAAQAKLDASRSQLDQGWAQYNEGLRQYEEGLEKFNSGLEEYNSGIDAVKTGREELDKNKQDANTRFTDAENELNDAQDELDSQGDVEVFVMDRSKNPGAVSLSHDAASITKIATFLPFMFFLVAALVVLTSMTRMVDEERLDIGTHKALGYGKARITSKYMIYGALASGLGSVLGVLLLGTLLPWFIMTSYGISYTVPIFSTPLDPIITAEAIGISVIVALLATWGAAAASLREKPATLMLPKAPKAGKRILLERIGFIWKHLSFSHKVTARNLFRYKRRFFMAVIGIAGCTALLMVGFGLRDAIGDIVSNQYEEIMTYDAQVLLKKDATDKELTEVDGRLSADGAESSLVVDDFTMAALGEEDLRIEVIVPKRVEQLSEFVNLRQRESGEPLTLSDDSIILTEKAARVLGVSVGDQVTLYEENAIGDAEGKGYRFTVSGIAENYLSHFAFMTPTLYKKTFGESPEYNRILINLDEGQRDYLETDLLSREAVSAVNFTADDIVTYEDMLSVMNKLIIVIVLLAAALAFVVLYNLTNINITERTREIATLKVLGFTEREVDAYIFREIIIMVILGALIGCLLGIPLTFYIAEAAETASMMFGRTIAPLSFVISFAITVLFAFVVAFAMRRKLAKVNMVESLKSIE